MKYILSLLIFCSAYCNAQVKDSSVLSILSTTETISFGTTITSPKYDTVKVIMLVCDTGRLYIGDSPLRILDGEVWYVSSSDQFKSNSVWWQLGYEVRVVSYYGIGYYGQRHDLPMYQHKEYLDSSKKPFSKSIIIWLTK